MIDSYDVTAKEGMLEFSFLFDYLKNPWPVHHSFLINNAHVEKLQKEGCNIIKEKGKTIIRKTGCQIILESLAGNRYRVHEISDTKGGRVFA